MELIRSFIIMLLTCSFMLTGTPSHAAENGTCAADPILIVLTDEPGSAPYIQPTCSKCPGLKVERQTGANGGTYGVLELTYFDKVYVTFAGTIEMTVWLVDGTKHPVTIDDVLLTNGDEAGWVIDGTSQWSWCDVEMVELVFVVGG